MLINAARGVGFIPSFVDTSRYENIVTRGVDPLYRPRRYYAIYKKENSNPHTQVLFNMLASYYEGTLWMPKVFY